MPASLDELIDKCTDEKNTEDDWSLILEICEHFNSKQSKKFLRSILRRVFHRNPHVNVQALTLLDACSKNIGKPFNLELSSKEFVTQVKSKIGGLHQRVRIRFCFIIAKWVEAFKNDPELDLMSDLYRDLKADYPDEVGAEDELNMSNRKIRTPVDTTKEDDDFAKAIALSLKEAEKSKGRQTTSALYPTTDVYGSSPTRQQMVPSPVGGPVVGGEAVRARALYDFEAAEDNELTFMAGEIVLVLDKSDAHWWRGSNHRGEGLFPSNFVTLDLTANEKPAGRYVNFNEVVKVVEVPKLTEPVCIDQSKVEECLHLIEEADPTGELKPDPPQLETLEEHCRQMGPLIDTELQKVDKQHNVFTDMNQVLMDAFSMYNNLMQAGPASSMGPGGSMQPSSMYASGQPPIHQMQQMSLNYGGGTGYEGGYSSAPYYAPPQQTDPSYTPAYFPPTSAAAPGTYDQYQQPGQQYGGFTTAGGQYGYTPTAPTDTNSYSGNTMPVSSANPQQDFNFYTNQNNSQSIGQVPSMTATNPAMHQQPLM